MQTDWEGYYLDGRTAARERAAIRLMRRGIEVSTERGLTFLWPYDQVRQTQGFYAGQQVRLEKGEGTGEALLISDVAFLSALRHVAPELGFRFHDLAHRLLRVHLILLATLAVIGISVALYLWGIPSVAAFAARRVPVAWEEQLGLSMIGHLVPPAKRCEAPTLQRAIEEIVSALTAPLTSNPYTFRVVVADSPVVNALAAPGGYIVLFRGLVERTRTQDELAGVLAHELQHVLHRHATRALLQHASTGVLLAAVTGDASSAMAYGVRAARTLGVLRYSRLSEEEADSEAIRMLRAAGIDAAGMIDFFDRLVKVGGDIPAFVTYLSTHPDPGDRLKKLRSLAGQSDGSTGRRLPSSDWGEIARICRAAGG